MDLRGVGYNSRLAVARLGRRPLLVVPHTRGTSLRSSIPIASRAVGSLLGVTALRLCPREESNLDLSLRRAALYPLSYEDKKFLFKTPGTRRCCQ